MVLFVFLFDLVFCCLCFYLTWYCVVQAMAQYRPVWLRMQWTFKSLWLGMMTVVMVCEESRMFEAVLIVNEDDCDVVSEMAVVMLVR